MRDAVVHGGRGFSRRGSSDAGRSSILAGSKSSLTAAEEHVICERQDRLELKVDKMIEAFTALSKIMIESSGVKKTLEDGK